MPAASSVHEFGLFRLDSAERLLLRAGQHVSLTPKAFDLLVYLVDHAGRLVTKQALMTELWPNSFVEESNLTFTVSALRKALGDGQDGEQFIQTVPTRGYRFVAPVTREGNPSISSTSGKPPGSIPALVRRIGMAALAVAALATVAVLVRRSPEPAGPLAHHRFTIPLPDSGVDVASPEWRIPVAQISPDGSRVAFIVRSLSARLASRIWLQRLDDLHPEEVTGSEGALSLFWAPDSQQLAFFTFGGGEDGHRIKRHCPDALRALRAGELWQWYVEPQWIDRVPFGGWTAAQCARWRQGTRAHHKRRPIPGGAETHGTSVPAGWPEVFVHNPKRRR